ncbi:Uncharacterized conserved protein, DUF58 family, contains vWF domain [Paenibacillus sophorae]|uniref:DUF58 domain-containing protein n=1 Tax=Paenibacillus sophorae TaxID=1333845 RepID=A0A1H8S770_9BACL|nr:DUF58 domain-containing protein [Paenibacillus sophorae]QWU16860.1 DUF58 domain-containing protein [Paenibacillus sophorae]SEO74376.1 Uncharacterized conserved protein, DUF58 family, contains vWF domain [Paenibacillus sophorae]
MIKPIRRPDSPAVSPNPNLPSQWARALAAMGIIAGLYGWLGGSALLFLLIFIGLVMLGGLLLQVLGPSKFELVRTLSPIQPTAGNSVLVKVDLSFRCRLPIPWMMIEEHWTCGDHRLLLFPGFRRTFQYTYSLERLPRGRQQLRSCRVSWGDLPGWFTGTSAPEGNREFKVLPAPLYCGEIYADSGAGPGVASAMSRRRKGAEEESDIRNYQPGDPMNRVDWKNTARRGSLQSRVPEREKGRMFCVVLDNCPASYETPWESLPPRGSSLPGTPAFELAVSAALGLLLAAERAGSYAQLFTGGWPEGMARYEGMGIIPARVLDTLADVAPDGTRTLARLLEDASRQCIPGMGIAVITGRPDREAALTISRLLAQGIKVDLYYVWDRAASVRSAKQAALYEEAGGRFSAVPERMRKLNGQHTAVSALSAPAATICGSLGRLGAGLYCLEHALPHEGREGTADELSRKPSAR